ncbi:DNA recombination protein RmuC [Meridianimarinicoccus roseus]|uniref:DNA recombination protein RmuC homolog n=1 Tax=Meridianimarinicoccus roseus TaxID=2072018 RepID=A0A2V2LEA6_9RHOB|nr:DNA recombination protein RmuC [Meridianimarinicoccus roseus]
MTLPGGLILDPADPVHLALLGAMGALALMLVLLLAALRAQRRQARMLEPLAQQLGALGRAQQQLAGGLSQVTDAQLRSQQATMATLEARLADVSRSMGDSLQGSATRTARSLGELQQRLETIDRAQANIEKLSGNVLGLQDILSNKQARGAFGEIQLHEIVSKALPPDSFTMQATLGNGKRADCLIHMPMPPGPLVIDSKFPLEPYEALVAAESDHERGQAARDLRMAVRRHIRAIAEKYIIEGETADGAVMFVPSEAVYSELHARYSDLVREGFAARVWLVSPTTCMATLNTLRSVLKDVRMREQAGLIRRELHLLHADVDRLVTRVDNLDRHFGQAQKDLADIRVSADKAGRRAQRLDSFDFADTARDEAHEENPSGPVGEVLAVGR